MTNNTTFENYDWIRNLFILTDTRNLFLAKEELAELKNNQSLLLMYKEGDLDSFWGLHFKNSLEHTQKSVNNSIHSSIMYICKESFSTMINLKSMKCWNLKMLNIILHSRNYKMLCSTTKLTYLIKIVS